MNIPSLKHDREAEKRIVGIVLVAGDECDDETLDLVFDRLATEDFFDRELRSIFVEARQDHRAGNPVSGELICRRLVASHRGIGALLVEARTEHVTAAHAQSYIEILKGCTKQRAVVKSALDALNSPNPQEAAEILRRGLSELDEADTSAPLVTATEATASYVEFLATDHRALPRTALTELDVAIGGGVDFGEMVILAARPSHGKTAIALQFAHNWTDDGIPVLYVSLEMSATALGKRIMQFSSNVPEERWRMDINEVRGDLEDYHHGRADIFICDRLKTLDAIVREIGRAVKRKGVRAVIIDYAQLIQATGKSRYEMITHISTVLRGLASEHQIIMLVLAQMSREIESRKRFVPIMSDIKESGQFEQDADVVVFLVWPHRIDSSQPAHEYQFFVAKNRNRPIMSSAFVARFEPSRQRVVSPRPQDQSNYEHAFADHDPHYIPE